ncbi:MAG: hypothetical protein ABSC94_29985 [Polyangiaceae bacterium]
MRIGDVPGGPEGQGRDLSGVCVSSTSIAARAAVRQLLADGHVVTRPAPRRGVRLYLKHMAPPSDESPPRAKDSGPGGDE